MDFLIVTKRNEQNNSKFYLTFVNSELNNTMLISVCHVCIINCVLKFKSVRLKDRGNLKIDEVHCIYRDVNN